MTDCATDTLIVRFPEASIECFSWEDADALRSCRDFLTDHFGHEPSFDACAELFPDPIAHRRLAPSVSLGGRGEPMSEWSLALASA